MKPPWCVASRPLISVHHWFQRDLLGGRARHAQAAQIQVCTADAWFIFFHHAFQQIADFHFMTSVEHTNFYLALGATFAFGEADFHKIKDREPLSRSHNNINTADDHEGD
jgi:hypothetical protein